MNSETLKQIFIDLNEVPDDLPPHSLVQTLSIENGDMEAISEEVKGNKMKNLSLEQKNGIFQMLLQESQFGKIQRLTKNSIDRIAAAFSVLVRSVYRFWKLVKSFVEDGAYPDLNPKTKEAGRKKKEINLELVKSIPFSRRSNIRSLSNEMGVPKSNMHRRIKEGLIRPHSNALKPYLSDENKKSRLGFCLSMINEDTMYDSPSFIDMFDRIHIDEKWFYMSNTSQKYYLHPNEAEPYRTCKSKRFITKIMFLAAVARPRTDKIFGASFDGKIGIWPFVYKEPAKRNSKNRAAGTLETKPILSITKEVTRSCLIEKLLPAIKVKWPSFSSKHIFIQQDNARPHLDVSDFEFNSAANTDGFQIKLCCQPANSPDMNVLDLGFFRAIDSLQHQEAPSNIDEFITAVEKAYQIFLVQELTNVFLTLQLCMTEVMKINGGNNYKIPHMIKHKLLRMGELPECFECDKDILMAAMNSFSNSM